MKGELFDEPFLSQFKQGIFEPEDLSNSAPLSLYLLCTKYIINNVAVVKVRCNIPTEISENLIEVCFSLFEFLNLCSIFFFFCFVSPFFVDKNI